MENGSTPGNAGRRQVIATLKEKEYTFLEPGLDELSLFESRVKSKRLEIYLNAAVDTPTAEKQAMIHEILRMPLEVDAIDDALATVDGARYMLYLCLRSNESVTLDNLSEIVDLSNMEEATAIIAGLGADETNPQTQAEATA